MNEERARVDEEAWGALREVAFGSHERMDRLWSAYQAGPDAVRAALFELDLEAGRFAALAMRAAELRGVR